MPRLTSSGQDSCCQTLIAHVARYWSAVLPSSGYTCTHHHHRVAHTYQCSLSFPSGRHVQEGWLDSCKTTNTFDSRWWVLKLKNYFLSLTKKRWYLDFFFYWKKPTLLLSRPPTVDVLQMAVHERPDAGWEACHGWRQWNQHSENVWEPRWAPISTPTFTTLFIFSKLNFSKK